MSDSNAERRERVPLPVSVRVTGAVVAYRLFDVGYAIDLRRAADLLAASAPERVRPVRGEAQALRIPNPPITVPLGTAAVPAAGATLAVELSARIFDFGVISLRLRVPTPEPVSWEAFDRLAQPLRRLEAVEAVVQRELRALTDRIRAAIERPILAEVREDYLVFRVTTLAGPDGTTLANAELAEALGALSAADVAPLLLQEARPLSDGALRDLLPHRFSYFRDDLAILAWEQALVIESGEGDTDLEYILEFANAQLLELRYYDSLLDAELPRLYDDIEAARRRYAVFPGRRFAGLLSRLQGQVADSTELVERVENALKVTDDVYLARVYSAALELFRGAAWRAGIDRKLGILRDTYAMLNDEAQAARSETLEIAIVALILVEIVMALV